jgi:small subunit ribosomal protein S20
MAITTSAKKAIRNSARKRAFNLRNMSNMRNSIKNIKKLVQDKKTNDATALISKAYQAIDKAAKRGIIKKNTAARKKSRLTRFVNKTS